MMKVGYSEELIFVIMLLFFAVVVITFVSEDVVVSENNGTTFVCVERSAVTEFNMSIFINVTIGTADGKNSSFIETTMTIVSHLTQRSKKPCKLQIR